MEISRRIHISRPTLPAVVEERDGLHETGQRISRDKDKALVRRITQSPTFRRYREAFSNATGLPLSLQSINDFAVAHTGNPNQRPFCALLIAHNATCAESLRFQSRLQQKSMGGPVTLCSRFGLYETAVPVKVGDRLIGFLHTGQVFFREPTARQSRKALQELRELGLDIGYGQFLRVYRSTPVFRRCAYDGVVRLLECFASQIAGLANRLVLEQTTIVPAHIAQARQFICEHYNETLNLSKVSQYVGVSRFVLCKDFRRTVGLTFKDYVSRVRVEKAKAMLVTAKSRVSEAAYSCGFSSLSNFNRHFRRIAGQSPTRFRKQVT